MCWCGVQGVGARLLMLLCCTRLSVCLCLQEEERERRADFVPEQSAIQTDNIEVWRVWLRMECGASRQRCAGALPAAVSTHTGGAGCEQAAGRVVVDEGVARHTPTIPHTTLFALPTFSTETLQDAAGMCHRGNSTSSPECFHS